jgi:hypothetical protein
MFPRSELAARSKIEESLENVACGSFIGVLSLENSM